MYPPIYMSIVKYDYYIIDNINTCPSPRQKTSFKPSMLFPLKIISEMVIIGRMRIAAV